jgi:hypothetical protein
MIFGELETTLVANRFARIKHQWFPGHFYLALDINGFEDIGDLQEWVDDHGGYVKIFIICDPPLRLKLDECEIEEYIRPLINDESSDER